MPLGFSTRSFDSRLAVRMPAGGEEKVDIRTLPLYRVEGNEAHTEGVYGMVFAGNNQGGNPISKIDKEWLGLIDTNQPDVQLATFPFGHDYAVTGRSLVAFGLSAEDSATRRLRQGVGSILDVMETPLPAT